MKMTSYKLVPSIILNLVTIPLALASASFSPACPKEIQTAQHLTSPHPKWEIIPSQPHHFLNSVTFYSGNPKELASLKPDFSNNKEAKWSFSSDKPIYVVCEYNQTEIQLAQSLPAKITHCEVIYDQTATSEKGFIPKRVECYK